MSSSDAAPDAGRELGGGDETASESWAGRGVDPFYFGRQHWRQTIAQRVLAHRPTSVLEFGSNAGANLHEIRNVDPRVGVLGIDVNEAAVEAGRSQYGIDLRAGDESLLSSFGPRSFDVSFTVSVIDHVEAPADVVSRLWAVTSAVLILLEPVAPRTGRVDADASETDAWSAVPHSYSWDYAELLGALPDVQRASWTPYPLSNENLGPFYWLIEASRETLT